MALRWIVMGMVVAGCATPRTINKISLTGDEVRMLYAGRGTGVIACRIAADGSLEACRNIPINFRKKGE